MKLMEISIFEIRNKELSLFTESFKGHHLKFYEDFLNEKNVDSAKNCEIISIFIYSKYLIMIISAGVEHEVIWSGGY